MANPAPFPEMPEPSALCRCGGVMCAWNGSRVYRDAEDVTVLRCVACGAHKPLPPAPFPSPGGRGHAH